MGLTAPIYKDIKVPKDIITNENIEIIKMKSAEEGTKFQIYINRITLNNNIIKN